MWAQLIKVRMKPGADLTRVADLLASFEQPGSGLLRELFMQDQSDPRQGYILAVFDSQEAARAREQDPRRAEGARAMKELMAETLDAPPEFVDMTVTTEWEPAS